VDGPAPRRAVDSIVGVISQLCWLRHYRRQQCRQCRVDTLVASGLSACSCVDTRGDVLGKVRSSRDCADTRRARTPIYGRAWTGGDGSKIGGTPKHSGTSRGAKDHCAGTRASMFSQRWPAARRALRRIRAESFRQNSSPKLAHLAPFLRWSEPEKQSRQRILLSDHTIDTVEVCGSSPHGRTISFGCSLLPLPPLHRH
jgi:hypothetical protein